MFLGLTFIGWAILVLAYLPIAALLFWLARRFGWQSKAFGVTAVLTSIPFVAAIAEGAYVEHNWRALCATAKTEVKRKVVVEGFYDDGYRTHGWEVLKGGKQGFRFVEWKDKEGRIWRTEGFNEPELRTVQINKPTARFYQRTMPLTQPVSHLLERREDTVLDSFTGEVIAQKIMGFRYPAFADRIWRQYFGSAPEICEDKRTIWGDTLIGIDRKEEFK